MNRTALVVSRNSRLLRIVRQHLVSDGVRVLTAGGRSEALRMHLEFAAPIVFIDGGPGDGDPSDLCRSLRVAAEGGAVYCILILGAAPQGDAGGGPWGGADDYLIEPFGRFELLSRLRLAERIVALEGCGRDDGTEVQASSMSGLGVGAAATGGHVPRGEGPARVLVADDDRATRALYRRLLEKDGFVVLESADGVEALARVESDRPDLAVVDAMMPRLDGRELTRRIKGSPATRHIPVIMVSAHSDERDIVEGLDAGADEYLAKPVLPYEFMVRVRSMARLHASTTELLRSHAARGEQARMLNLLLALSRELTGATDLDGALQRTVEVTAELARCRRVSIMLPDAADPGYLRVARSIGIDAAAAVSIRVPVGAPVAGEVYLRRRPVILNGPHGAEGGAGSAGAPAGRYDSQFFVSAPMVCTALSTAGRVMGVLNVTEREDGTPFNLQELEFIEILGHIAAVAIDDIQARQARDDAHDSIARAMGHLAERRDDETGRHVERVSRFCVMLARELRAMGRFSEEIDDAFLWNLERVAPLHDIGKVAIPDAILLKPGALTDEEMAVMRTHTTIGREMIRSVCARSPGVPYLRMAEEIIYSHHERYDGTGYPEGLRGEAIPLAARLVALADMYDAMTSRRVYKEAATHAEAVRVIREGSGTQFDPAVVQAFLRCEGRFAGLAGADREPREAAGGLAGRRQRATGQGLPVVYRPAIPAA